MVGFWQIIHDFKISFSLFEGTENAIDFQWRRTAILKLLDTLKQQVKCNQSLPTNINYCSLGYYIIQLTHLLKNGYCSEFVSFVHMHIIVIIRVNSWNDHNSQ